MKFKFVVLLSAISYLLLAIYSFSQVDLNLTLSQNFFYQSFQKILTSLGYYHRPLSTAIYIIIIFLLLISYFLLLALVKRKTVTFRQIWLLIGLMTVILLFSYPAFSHDIFNYLFDARIVTKYGLSPWQFKPLDFPQDDWIRFMRWTHRPSIYPPIWIAISLIPSTLGMGKFIITLGLFKVMVATAYLYSCRLMFQIAQKLYPQKPSHHLTILSLFAFNPLVIIESLVNAHMEIVMILFGLLAVKFLFYKKTSLAWLTLAASIGIKFMTAFLGLIIIKGEKYFRPAIWLGMIATAIFITYYGFQPWYLLWTLPFILLLPPDKWEIKFITLASISALFWHLPFINQGDFNLPDHRIRLFLYVVLPFTLTIGIYKLKSLTKINI